VLAEAVAMMVLAVVVAVAVLVLVPVLVVVPAAPFLYGSPGIRARASFCRLPCRHGTVFPCRNRYGNPYGKP